MFVFVFVLWCVVCRALTAVTAVRFKAASLFKRLNDVILQSAAAAEVRSFAERVILEDELQGVNRHRLSCWCWCWCSLSSLCDWDLRDLLAMSSCPSLFSFLFGGT